MSSRIDDDPENPEWTSDDWARAVPVPRRPLGVRSQIRIDGAVAYSVRVVPSNKVLGRFPSTLDAWDLIEDEVDAGRNPKTLVLDWHRPDGTSGKLAAGRTLVAIARMSNGAPWPGDRSSREAAGRPRRPPRGGGSRRGLTRAGSAQASRVEAKP